jgi:hypothetical protein
VHDSEYVEDEVVEEAERRFRAALDNMSDEEQEVELYRLQALYEGGTLSPADERAIAHILQID